MSDSAALRCDPLGLYTSPLFTSEPGTTLEGRVGLPGKAMVPASMPKEGSLMGSPGFFTSGTDGTDGSFTDAGAPLPWNICTWANLSR